MSTTTTIHALPALAVAAARKELRPHQGRSSIVGVTVNIAKHQTLKTRDPTMGRPQMWSRGSVSGRLHTTGGGEASVYSSHSKKDGLRW